MKTTGFALVTVLVTSAVLAGCSGSDKSAAATCEALKNEPPGDPQNAVALWDTTMGCIVVELYLAKTPITAGNFVNLTKSGFYDGTRFHRVIDGFMIQDGDPNSKDASKKGAWGTGGPGYTIKDEFPCKDGTRIVGSPGTGCSTHGGLLYTHATAGVLSMANGGPNTGGSQYFITLVPTTYLDGKHAIFGKVLKGMDVVQAIGKVPTERDRPLTDVVITTLRMAGASADSPTTTTTPTTTPTNSTASQM